MEFDELKEILLMTAKRSIKRQYRYFILDRFRLSESEVRHVMAKILDDQKIFYGIEIATQEKHSLTGHTLERRALTDLVIYGRKKNKENPIWVEFKRGQPNADNIKKDFIKMIKEPSIGGACFFHILPKVSSVNIKKNERAKDAIINKYNNAYKVVVKSRCQKKWFILFFLDSRSKQYYLLQKENICEIDSFADGKWAAI